LHEYSHSTARVNQKPASRVASAALALLLACPNAVAQQVIDSWTTENGLPQNSVNDIVQTRDSDRLNEGQAS
jgi:hypothetical protein